MKASACAAGPSASRVVPPSPSGSALPSTSQPNIISVKMKPPAHSASGRRAQARRRREDRRTDEDGEQDRGTDQDVDVAVQRQEDARDVEDRTSPAPHDDHDRQHERHEVALDRGPLPERGLRRFDRGGSVPDPSPASTSASRRPRRRPRRVRVGRAGCLLLVERRAFRWSLLAQLHQLTVEIPRDAMRYVPASSAAVPAEEDDRDDRPRARPRRRSS